MKHSAFLNTLSVRTANCLANLGYRQRDEIARAIKTGLLHPRNPTTRNFGAKALAEVRAALGMPRELTVKDTYEIRCRLAAQLFTEGYRMTDIALILKLGTKNNARRHVFHGRNLDVRRRTKDCKIVAAAVRLRGELVLSLPRPARHHNILHAMATTAFHHRDTEQGFLDYKGKFQNRENALAMALAAGQLTMAKKVGNKSILFSEDLW